LHFDGPGCSGPDNSAIRFPGIEGNAGQIGDRLPRAVIAFSFFGVRYSVSDFGGIGDMLTVASEIQGVGYYVTAIHR